MDDPTQGVNRRRIWSRPVRLVAAASLIVLVCAMTMNREFYEQLENNIFFSLTFAGCCAVFLSVRPLREFPQAMALAGGLSGLHLFVSIAPLKALPVFALLGMSSLLLLAVRGIWNVDQQSWLLRDCVLPPGLFLALGYFGSAPLEITVRLHPKTLDRFLYSFDQSLGVQLSCLLGQIVLPSHLMTRALLGIYFGLPIILMLVYARQLVRDRTFAMSAFLAFVIAGPLGVVFYNLVPACGPLCFLGARFPFEPISTAQLRQLPLEAVASSGARNAFPSLHLGWALLTWWYSKGLSFWTKAVLMLFLLGTGCATLALGEHYFIDLVVAFPFALMIQASCSLNLSALSGRSLAPVITGLALMLGWVALLWWGLPLVWLNRGIPWLLVIGTIGLTLALQDRLGVSVKMSEPSPPRGHAVADSVGSARRHSTTTNMGR